MDPHPGAGRFRRLARQLLLAFGGWTFYAIVATLVLRLVRARAGEPPGPFAPLFLVVAASSWTWALLTPAVVAFTRRFPMRSWSELRRLPLVAAFAIAIHVAHEVLLIAVSPNARGGARFPEVLLDSPLLNLFIVAGLMAMVHAAIAQQQAERMRGALLETELRLLRMQLQPHFLFNTLNGVAELVHQHPDRAERALVRLADLLRWSLQSSSLREVPLREELGALETYLEIQRLRHGDGMRFEVEAAPDALPMAVPSLLLQPLVENAIRHGVRGASRGTVRVTAARHDGRLQLVVEDDGRGFAAGWREGTGLGTTRARLRGLYGDAHALRIDHGGAGGRVVVEMPARPVAAHAPAGGA